jgi:hypothetical protein
MRCHPIEANMSFLSSPVPYSSFSVISISSFSNSFGFITKYTRHSFTTLFYFPTLDWKNKGYLQTFLVVLFYLTLTKIRQRSGTKTSKTVDKRATFAPRFPLF